LNPEPSLTTFHPFSLPFPPFPTISQRYKTPAMKKKNNIYYRKILFFCLFIRSLAS
jgi:hypothetical protein